MEEERRAIFWDVRSLGREAFSKELTARWL